MLLDEVDDDLGVGLGVEDVALLLERELQLAEVLDDPVQHDRDLVLLAAGERMRVLLRDLAVRGPARVSETGRRLRAVVLRDLLQVLEVADRAQVVEPLVLEHREPGRVIAPILEALQTVDQERLRPARPDVSDDPAHGVPHPPFGRKKPGPRDLQRRRAGQPSSRRTRSEMLAQSRVDSWKSSASARTRTTGSVPDGRTRIRPRSAKSAFMRSTSASRLGGMAFVLHRDAFLGLRIAGHDALPPRGASGPSAPRTGEARRPGRRPSRGRGDR